MGEYYKGGISKMNYRPIIAYSLLIILTVGIVTATMSTEECRVVNSTSKPVESTTTEDGIHNYLNLRQQAVQYVREDTPDIVGHDSKSLSEPEILPGRYIVKNSDDQTPPVQTFTIGDPQTSLFWYGQTYPVVSTMTPIWINSTDTGPNATGSSHIKYSLWQGNDPYPDSNGVIDATKLYEKIVDDNSAEDLNPKEGRVSAVIYVTMNCYHEIIYQCWDYAGNTDGWRDRDFFADCCPPYTSKHVGQPQYGSDYPNWASNATPLWFNASDYCCFPDGSGVASLILEVYWKDSFDPNETWTLLENITVSDNQTGDLDERPGKISYLFSFNESCFHEIHWYSVDTLGNIEAAHKQKHKIDADPPSIIKEIGYPHCRLQETDYCVDPQTPITLSAVDQGCQGGVGVDLLRYQIWYNNSWSNWVTVDTEGTTIYLSDPCMHILRVYARDYLGNNITETETFYVDSTAPRIETTVGEPHCSVEDDAFCVNTSTPITINVTDDDCCPSLTVWYSINNKSWINITEELPYTLRLEEQCEHILSVKAFDCLGHTSWDNRTLYVDETPPVINITVGDPQCELHPGEEYCITSDTPLTIDADNNDCCISSEITARYRINEGNWTDLPRLPWTVFIEEQCMHTLHVEAEDCLGNTASSQMLFYVDDTTPEIDIQVGMPHCMVRESPLQSEEYCVNTSTPITINATDSGCCSDLTVWYRINNDSWSDITEQLPYVLRFGEACRHNLSVKAFDCLGHTSWDNRTLYVDETPPVINITVGDPQCELHPGEEYCITSDTPLTIDAYNEDCCVISYVDVRYKINNGSWQSLATEDIPYTLFLNESCMHTLTIVAEDCLGNNATEVVLFHVDNTTPEVDLSVHDPSCFVDEGVYCVKTTTPLTFDARDFGCCDDLTVWYKVNNATWVDITGQVPYNYSFSEECHHTLELFAFDCLNHSTSLKYSFYVNDHPPGINISVGDPKCTQRSDEFCITTETPIHIDAFHQGCCDFTDPAVRYTINDGNWTTLSELPETIFIDELCLHTLTVEAEDCLGNNATKEVVFHIDDSLPEINITVGDPHIIREDPPGYWVSCLTPITIDVVNLGCCETLTTVRYQINEDGWQNITEPLPYTHYFSDDCMHLLTIEAVDCYGNIVSESETFYVDCTPPNSTKTVQGPSYDADLNNDGDTNDTGEHYYWLRTNESQVCIVSEDQQNELCSSGLNYTHIELWWDSDRDDEIDTKCWEITDTTGSYCFFITHDCLHEIRWYSVDILGNSEEPTLQRHRADSHPPTTTLEIGMHSFCTDAENRTYVSPGTPLWLNTTDTLDPCAVGCRFLFYNISWYNETLEQWIVLESGYEADNQVELHFSEECMHQLMWYSEDYLGNQEAVHMQEYRVDATPPILTKTVGEPSYTDDNRTWWVTTDTEINVTASDQPGPCMSGGVSIDYRYKMGEDRPWTRWKQYTGNFSFSEGCTHYLSIRAQDCAGNTAYDNQTFIVHGPSGESSPKITIEYPRTGDILCNKSITVSIHAIDDQTPWEHLDLGLYIPDGRRNAPTLWYEVTPADMEDYYMAEIPIYHYQNGAEITLHAYAVDEDNNTGFAIPVTFTVCSSTLWDQWMQLGWNLLVLPPGIECNQTCERVFHSLEGSCDLVYHYDPDEGWSSYWPGEPYNDLTSIDAGKQYWVHITNPAGIRYYIALPEIYIQQPEDQSTHTTLNHTGGITWNSEAGITEVSIHLYYREESTMYYWNETTGTTTPTALPCMLSEGYLQNWSYDTSMVNWTAGKTYTIKARAKDGYDCIAYDTITFTNTEEYPR